MVSGWGRGERPPSAGRGSEGFEVPAGEVGSLREGEGDAEGSGEGSWSWEAIENGGGRDGVEGTLKPFPFHPCRRLGHLHRPGCSRLLRSLQVLRK